MEKLKFCITDDDVAAAERYKVSNPVLFALQNATGTLWRLSEDGLAMETMPPFRAAMLPLPVLRGWHAESDNGRKLPREFDLVLHQLQPNSATSDSDLPKDVLSDAMVQNALLQILESNGWPNWRAVCSHIFAEQFEPYRTIVLTHDALESAKNWLRSLQAPAWQELASVRHGGDGSTPAPNAPLCLPATLHSPLAGAAAQSITLNLPPHSF